MAQGSPNAHGRNPPPTCRRDAYLQSFPSCREGRIGREIKSESRRRPDPHLLMFAYGRSLRLAYHRIPWPCVLAHSWIPARYFTRTRSWDFPMSLEPPSPGQRVRAPDVQTTWPMSGMGPVFRVMPRIAQGCLRRDCQALTLDIRGERVRDYGARGGRVRGTSEDERAWILHASWGRARTKKSGITRRGIPRARESSPREPRPQ
jgi:hypothetical protein